MPEFASPNGKSSPLSEMSMKARVTNDGLFFWGCDDSATMMTMNLTQVHNGGGNFYFATGHYQIHGL
jgi:hypothetical protein